MIFIWAILYELFTKASLGSLSQDLRFTSKLLIFFLISLNMPLETISICQIQIHRLIELFTNIFLLLMRVIILFKMLIFTGNYSYNKNFDMMTYRLIHRI